MSLLTNWFGRPARDLRLRPGFECLFFFHVPRTGGMTMDGILRRLQTRYRRADDADILARPHRFQRGVIAGHITSKALWVIPRDAAKFTLLRDPVSHAVSLYAWARALRHDKAHMAKGGDAVRLVDAAYDLDFMGFLTSEDRLLCSYMRNPQTRIFGCGNHYVAPHVMGPHLLQRAIRVLEGFDYVGVTDRFEQSIEGICERFFVGSVGCFDSVHRINLMVDKDDDTIRRLNRLDVQLHAWALERLGGTAPATAGASTELSSAAAA